MWVKIQRKSTKVVVDPPNELLVLVSFSNQLWASLWYTLVFHQRENHLGRKFSCDFSTLPTHPLSWIRKQPMASSRKLRQWLCWVGFICGKEGLLPRRWWGMERRAPFFQTGSQSPQPPMDRRARKPTPFINGERQVHFHEQCVEYWQQPVGQK